MSCQILLLKRMYWHRMRIDSVYWIKTRQINNVQCEHQRLDDYQLLSLCDYNNYGYVFFDCLSVIKYSLLLKFMSYLHLAEIWYLLDLVHLPCAILYVYVFFYCFQVSEVDLPDCRPRQVCSKVDLYDTTQPWIEKKCRCLGHRPCSR